MLSLKTILYIARLQYVSSLSGHVTFWRDIGADLYKILQAGKRRDIPSSWKVPKVRDSGQCGRGKREGHICQCTFNKTRIKCLRKAVTFVPTPRYTGIDALESAWIDRQPWSQFFIKTFGFPEV